MSMEIVKFWKETLNMIPTIHGYLEVGLLVDENGIFKQYACNSVFGSILVPVFVYAFLGVGINLPLELSC
jgi:hypothetical protein